MQSFLSPHYYHNLYSKCGLPAGRKNVFSNSKLFIWVKYCMLMLMLYLRLKILENGTSFNSFKKMKWFSFSSPFSLSKKKLKFRIWTICHLSGDHWMSRESGSYSSAPYFTPSSNFWCKVSGFGYNYMGDHSICLWQRDRSLGFICLSCWRIALVSLLNPLLSPGCFQVMVKGSWTGR